MSLTTCQNCIPNKTRRKVEHEVKINCCISCLNTAHNCRKFMLLKEDNVDLCTRHTPKIIRPKVFWTKPMTLLSIPWRQLARSWSWGRLQNSDFRPTKTLPRPSYRSSRRFQDATWNFKIFPRSHSGHSQAATRRFKTSARPFSDISSHQTSSHASLRHQTTKNSNL